MAGIQSSGAPTWSSRLTFIMAAVGSSVGLGNFWRFPYEAGEYGGGAFVFIYLLCVAFVAFPLLVSEFMIGRHAGVSAVQSLEQTAEQSGASRRWGIGGWTGIFASLMILSFYCVVGGWVLNYILFQGSGDMVGVSQAVVSETFDGLVGAADQNKLEVRGQLIFVVITAGIVAFGINGGIEKAVNILMPLFFLVFLGIVAYSAYVGNFLDALKFLFTPDFSKVTPKVFSAALGQAFFSVGVGVGLMITYGSYLSRDVKIPSSAGIIAGADTLVAIVAGLAIFPIVFAFGVPAEKAGASLLFKTLPIAFADMPGGQVVGTLFFLMAFIAAITSSISLLEVSVAWFCEQAGISRPAAASGLGFVVFVVGVGCVASPNYLDFLDVWSGSVLLPLGGLIVAVFTGWRLKKTIIDKELSGTSEQFRKFWFFLIRFVVPIGILAILVVGVWSKAGMLFNV